MNINLILKMCSVSLSTVIEMGEKSKGTSMYSKIKITHMNIKPFVLQETKHVIIKPRA